MAYDFTADSDIQTTLSGELTAQASEFETQVGQLYSEIDGLASSWKGEDYEAFNEGAHGYEKALADLKESIDLFAKHFERLSAGTEELAVSLATIIENALEGGEAGGAGGQGGAGGSGDSVDQDAARDQTKSDGSVNPYGGGRPDRIENPDGSYSYVYRDKDGKIRQKDTWDKDGNLIGQETYDEDGKTKNYSMQVNQDDGSYVVEKYDGDNILSHEERDADDKLIKSVEYGYDADGKNNLITTTNADGTRYEEDIANDEIVGIRVYDKDNELQFENTKDAAAIAAVLAAGGSWEIGSNGSYAIIDANSDDGSKITYNYDENGNKVSKVEYSDSDQITSEEFYDKNGTCTGKAEYDYDSEGRVKTKKNLDGDGSTVSKEEYVYDKDGNYSVTTTDNGGNASTEFYDKDGKSINAPETFGPDGSLLTEAQIKLNAENSANEYLANHGIDTTGSDYDNLTPSAKALVDQTVQTVTDLGAPDGSLKWQEDFKSLDSDIQKLVLDEYRGQVSSQVIGEPYGITHNIPADGQYDGRNIVVPELTKNDFNGSIDEQNSLRNTNAQIIVDSAYKVRDNLSGEVPALETLKTNLETNPTYLSLPPDEQTAIMDTLNNAISSRNDLVTSINKECYTGIGTDGTIGDATTYWYSSSDSSRYEDYHEAALAAEQ